MSRGPEVSVVLGSLDRLPYLRLALDSLRAELDGMPHEILVVDGGSVDGSIPWLAAQKDVVSIVQHNRGKWRGKPLERRSWGSFMNLAFRAARARFVCMVSDDCLVVPGAIRNGIARFDEAAGRGENPGAVAFYWRNWPEQEKYRVGLALGGKMFVNHGLYAKAALEAVGYAEEERYAFYHADSDLCLKMWEAGYACVDSPASFVEHFAHANPKLRARNSLLQRADWDAYLSRWEGIFYDRVKNDVGSWIELGHEDPHGTALAFHRFAARAAFVGRLRGLLRRVRR